MGHCVVMGYMAFEMLSAICFKLDQSKILSSGIWFTADYVQPDFELH